jgi:NTP pyrophosphatase (non-canonical NTP hydrolase)
MITEETTLQDQPYSQFVNNLCKSGTDILIQLQPYEAHLVHMAMGVSGEAGELLDAIKKSTIYRKPLDKENVIEECGDILFFVQGILNYYALTLEDAVEQNKEKLSKRYSAGKYSNEQAQQRADKQ